MTQLHLIIDNKFMESFYSIHNVVYLGVVQARLIGQLLHRGKRLRMINFYKRLLYSSDVFIHNMFCTFLCNNCDDGILFKSVFYRKSDAIHSVWSAFQDYVLC